MLKKLVLSLALVLVSVYPALAMATQTVYLYNPNTGKWSRCVEVRDDKGNTAGAIQCEEIEGAPPIED